MSNSEGIQTPLFDELVRNAVAPPPQSPGQTIPSRRRTADASPREPTAATPHADHLATAAAMDAHHAGRWHFGTSSWHFPGWEQLLYGASYPADLLSRHGLRAYAQHPLMRAVSLDRAFYRPLDARTYRALADQVGPSFRFLVKAPALVTDASLRNAADGRPSGPNPRFLDPETTSALALQPAVEGLGDRLGVLVFQLSPLSGSWLAQQGERLLDRLDALWSRLRSEVPAGTNLALELRDAALLSPALARHLKQHGVRYCLGLHDRMPPIDGQLDMLRALWPGDLVCRWNLRRGLRYEAARERFEPFNRLAAPDPDTRAVLARVAAATLRAGHRAFITINNKAEGSAPLSVAELARETACLLNADAGPVRPSTPG
jgi:uncharacterized protein YecE (DUF72 family)